MWPDQGELKPTLESPEQGGDGDMPVSDVRDQHRTPSGDSSETVVRRTDVSVVPSSQPYGLFGCEDQRSTNWRRLNLVNCSNTSAVDVRDAMADGRGSFVFALPSAGAVAGGGRLATGSDSPAAATATRSAPSAGGSEVAGTAGEAAAGG